MSNNFNPNFNRSQKPLVCFGCGDRKQGCHGSCERYRAEVAERAASPDIKQKEERVFMQNYKMEQKRRR